MGIEKTVPDHVMTVHEVSEYLRMSESTIYRLANNGKLPGRKIGGSWRFSQNELDRWVKQPPRKNKENSK